MERETAKEYFDRLSPEWESHYKRQGFDSHFFNTRREKILSMLPNGKGRLLDAGCGSGEFVKPIQSKGYQYHGIDISDGMIKQSRDRFPDSSFSVSSIENTKFRDNFFDCVICIGVLEYLKRDTKALDEISRILKPGGTLIATFPNRSSPLTRLELFLSRKIARRVGSLHKEYTPRAARNLIQKRFEIENEAFVSFLPINIGIRLAFPKGIEKLIGFISVILRWKAMGLTYIVKATSP
jgi:ubiquinone/menaquinone biosynthesis C-methylase UbiE